MRFLIVNHLISDLQINLFSDNSVTFFRHGHPEALRCFKTREQALNFIDYIIYLEDCYLAS